MPVKVSIVIPATRPQELVNALASVKAQTFTDWEVVVVTGPEGEGQYQVPSSIVKQIRKVVAETLPQPEYQAKGFTMVQTGNRKMWAEARNAALYEIEGQYVAFLDDDDLWFPQHLEQCVNAYEKFPLDIARFVVTSFYKVRKSYWRSLLDLQENLRREGIGISIQEKLFRDGCEHSGQQPYLSMMDMLNIDTITAACLFVPREIFTASQWIASSHPDGRAKRGEDLRFVQDLLLRGWHPIWIKDPPTCANMNYYGQDYLATPDETVLLGHLDQEGKLSYRQVK